VVPPYCDLLSYHPTCCTQQPFGHADYQGKQLQILPDMPRRHQNVIDHRVWLIDNAEAEAKRLEDERQAKLMALLQAAAWSYVSPDEIAEARGEVEASSEGGSSYRSQGFDDPGAPDVWEDTRQHLEALTSAQVRGAPSKGTESGEGCASSAGSTCFCVVSRFIPLSPRAVCVRGAV
jgi:hypothetical protein